MKRRQFVPPFLVGLIASFILSACTGLPLATTSNVSSTAHPSVTTITVSAAASLQDALDAIIPQFSQAYPNIAIEYNFGSSGALQQQIAQGAPADVFFSAATEKMDKLAAKSLIDSSSRQDVLANSLVLIAPVDSQLAITEISQLDSDKIDPLVNRLAVGEFRSVPAGQYAQQALKNFQLLEPLQSKFVFGNTVRNVLGAVESGNAELGIVYATDAALSEKVKVLSTVPKDSHSPIVYPVAAVEDTAEPEAAQTFIDFLLSEQIQSTFVEFGFDRL
ncbi:molybdate ABC transporter, periplasmic molybdate-binding protein [Synechococcus sp. PCC 7335]|uniref:molybdate ABC transporter substrate-binding protein n=1 Tax=Synechococcus sp. (strain ATCC 29403 / PCC 7335) TaxID=91464 RepID=UPI00017EBC93|nr:molybdate ABC transporter substrate-binding protein [Synechococcus sp. PCC 7335]EDX85870.1 molybdate ABC transporter, periplasmic molybdate-binding protein [Synechococcus sp. PCC 7335]